MTDRLAGLLFSVGVFRQILVACKENKAVYHPGFLSLAFCEQTLGRLTAVYSPLPTGDGMVCEPYPGGFSP